MNLTRTLCAFWHHIDDLIWNLVAKIKLRRFYQPILRSREFVRMFNFEVIIHFQSEALNWHFCVGVSTETKTVESWEVKIRKKWVFDESRDNWKTLSWLLSEKNGYNVSINCRHTRWKLSNMEDSRFSFIDFNFKIHNNTNYRLMCAASFCGLYSQSMVAVCYWLSLRF